MSNIPYTKNRTQYVDGTWADVVTVRFPASELRFRDIVLDDPQTRMADIAHLRYVKARLRGEDQPIVVVWACLENDQPADQLFPDLNLVTEYGEHLLSASSLLTYTLHTLLARGWLFWEAGKLEVDIPSYETIWRDRATTILTWLQAEKRLLLKSGSRSPTRADFRNFPVTVNAIPVGNAGFLRRVVDENRYRVAFNAAFFLLEHDDFVGHHSALGSPFNLAVHQGEIVRPPVYRRAMLWGNITGQWQVDSVGMEDVALVFSHDPDWSVPFVINAVEQADVVLYTRHYGVESQGRVIGHTPEAAGRIEFTVIDRRIVGWKRNGLLTIPQDGFVLSFAPGALDPHHLDSIIHHPILGYRFTATRFRGITEAIQCGPRLIQNGQSALTYDSFSREQFWISQMIDGERVVGLVPTDFPTDIDRTRAGRVGIGITEQQEIVLVAVSGVNSGYNLANTDSSGCTLAELTGHLLDVGAIEAINLDGGGSTQVFLEGGLIATPGDRRGLPGITYERMISSVGVMVAD